MTSGNSLHLALLLFSLGLMKPGRMNGQQKELTNKMVSLKINIAGGAYTHFGFIKDSINPLSWKLSQKDMPVNNRNGAPFQGHFLCLGRWGSPSEGEIKKGVPHNGEPSRDKWLIHSSSNLNVKMSCIAPLDGLHISRNVVLDKTAPLWKVEESVTNTSSLGRIYNIVQHATLGPPFLNTNTIVNSNAADGFLQEYCYPDPDVLSYKWPNAWKDTTRTPLDLQSSSGDLNYVSTHVFPDSCKYGWITATSPSKQLLIGYVWRTSEYPWLNIWHHSKDGVPLAKGLEFGTTGIGKPYSDLLQRETFFRGHQSYEYIDAAEVKRKSFFCFLVKVPEQFKGVEKIEVKGSSIVLTLNSGTVTEHVIAIDLLLTGPSL
ncbi:MAG: hypothetical protein H7Y03_01760 [Chitinophagaceae bacterium]|nr:hypothetical protein [Chitinophagaceae bacterium]